MHRRPGCPRECSWPWLRRLHCGSPVAWHWEARLKDVVYIAHAEDLTWQHLTGLHYSPRQRWKELQRTLQSGGLLGNPYSGTNGFYGLEQSIKEGVQTIWFSRSLPALMCCISRFQYPLMIWPLNYFAGILDLFPHVCWWDRTWNLDVCAWSHHTFLGANPHGPESHIFAAQSQLLAVLLAGYSFYKELSDVCGSLA